MTEMNKEKTEFPPQPTLYPADSAYPVADDRSGYFSPGFTKREWLAARFATEFIGRAPGATIDQLVSEAFRMADAFIELANKKG